MNDLYNRDMILKRLEFARLAEFIRIKSLYNVRLNTDDGSLYESEVNLFKDVKNYLNNHYKDIRNRVVKNGDNYDDKLLFYIKEFEEDQEIDNINTIKMIAVFPSLFNEIKSLSKRSYEEVKYLTILAVYLNEKHYSIKQFFENEHIISFVNDESFDSNMKVKLLNYFASFATNMDANITDDNFIFYVGGAISSANFDLVNDENANYFNHISSDVISEYQKNKKILQISQICPACNENWYMNVSNRKFNLENYLNFCKKELGDIEFKKDIKMIDDEIDVFKIRSEKSLTDQYRHECPRCVKKFMDKEKIGKPKVLNFKK